MNSALSSVFEARTEDEHVKADTQRPYISQARVVRLSSAHLGRHERGRTGGAADEVTSSRKLRAAKIGYLDMTICAEQKIVWLEIAMSNLVGVQVAQALRLSASQQAIDQTCMAVVNAHMLSGSEDLFDQFI